MVKFICKTLSWNLVSNSYRGPSGIEYSFQINIPTEIKNDKDIEYFRRASTAFDEIGLKEKIKEIIMPDKSKEKVLTFEDLKSMNRIDQVGLIKKLDPDAHIPTMEKARIELIMKLLKK